VTELAQFLELMVVFVFEHYSWCWILLIVTCSVMLHVLNIALPVGTAQLWLCYAVLL